MDAKRLMLAQALALASGMQGLPEIHSDWRAISRHPNSAAFGELVKTNRAKNKTARKSRKKNRSTK